MPAELTSPPRLSAHEPEPVVVSGELRCALTGNPVRPEEAYWAPPLITARELVTTVLRTAVTTPSNLGHVLMGEQPNVPYAPDARQQLASRRTIEQLKLLALLLLIAAVLIVPIVMLVA